jgi:hypothetical protein
MCMCVYVCVSVVGRVYSPEFAVRESMCVYFSIK